MSKVAHLKDFWHISGFRTKFIYILTKTLILRKCQRREKSARSRFFGSSEWTRPRTKVDGHWSWTKLAVFCEPKDRSFLTQTI